MLLNPAAKRLISHLSGTCLTRSAPCAALASGQPPAVAKYQTQTSPPQFRPIYSLDKDVQLVQKRRLANTSAGYFAPRSALTDSQRRPKEPRAIFNVFESSDHLPSLPVPHLEATLERLKETIWPIAMNSVEFANALHLIEKFSKSVGPKLDLLLREKAKQTKNWVTHDWWIREAYMKSRLPLVINCNPSMIYPNFPFEINGQRSVLQTIAQLISGVIDFKLALTQGLNPEATSPENQYHLDPFLCYDQYKNLFGALRVPGEECDSLALPEAPGTISDDQLSVVLSFRGKFFEIQLNDVHNEQSRVKTLESILEKLVESSPESSATGEQQLPGVGVLTTGARDQCAKAYRLLDQDSLEAMKKSQFVVCLDTIDADHNQFAAEESHHHLQRQQDGFLIPLTTAPADSEQHLASLARQILHGDRANIGNRWFDKPIQLIVVGNQKLDKFYGAGVNYEHSLAEAVVVTKMIEYSFERTVERQREQSRLQRANSEGKSNLFNSSEPIEFSVQKSISSEENQPHGGGTVRQLSMCGKETDDTSLVEMIKQAQANYISQIDQFDLSCLAYRNYGSNSIKSWHFSPDSWFQVALQLAYYNLHKRPGPCYESASTRRFAYGRTETIRSLTKDVSEFCQQPNYETLKSAVASHKTYAIAANNAAAIDRVLFAYRMIFNELKSNDWSWGLPPLDTTSTKSNGDAANVKLADLFSEKELNTLSAFFNNELIERSKKFALSTSQVSSPHSNIFMSFGPLLADGYGCCYNISGQQIVASISANSSNQSFSCEVNRLSEGLREALDRMRDIVEEQRRSGGGV